MRFSRNSKRTLICLVATVWLSPSAVFAGDETGLNNLGSADEAALEELETANEPMLETETSVERGISDNTSTTSGLHRLLFDEKETRMQFALSGTFSEFLHKNIQNSFRLDMQYALFKLPGILQLSAGPNLQYTVEKIYTNGTVDTLGSRGALSVGASARVNFLLKNRQILVPYFGALGEYVMVARGEAGLSVGGITGVALLLNSMDPSAAAQMYASNGIRRTYLTAEATFQNFSVPDFSISGYRLWIGLRLDY